MKFIYFTLKCIENKVKLKISRRVIFGIIGGIVLLFIVNSFSNNLIGKIVSRVKDRVLVTKDLIREQKSIDSEGVRSSFIWVSKIYLTNSFAYVKAVDNRIKEKIPQQIKDFIEKSIYLTDSWYREQRKLPEMVKEQ